MTSFRIAVAGAALVVLVGAVLEAQQAEPRRIAAAPAFNARALTSNPTKDWITNGGNVFNQRGAVEKDVLNPGAIAVCFSSKHWVIFTVWG